MSARVVGHIVVSSGKDNNQGVKRRDDICGITIIDSWKTGTHEVRVGEVEVAGKKLTIQFLKSLRLSSKKGEFVPASVSAGDKQLWSFRDDCRIAERTLAFMRIFSNKSKEEHVIIIIGVLNDQQGIVKVIPLVDLVKSRPISVSGNKTVMIGGRQPRELMWVKINLAKQLKRRFVLTEDERRLSRMAREDDERIKDLRREARREDKEKLTQKILSRRKVEAFTKDGRKVFGTPIVGEEYSCLPDRTPVIVVDSYDDERGKPGGLVEAFFFRRINGVPSKRSTKNKLSWEKPNVEEVSSAIEAELIILVVEGRRKEYLLFSKESVGVLRDQEVGEGTEFAVDAPDEKGCYPLVSLSSDGVKTIGSYSMAE